jgi:hypothetical protein
MSVLCVSLCVAEEFLRPRAKAVRGGRVVTGAVRAIETMARGVGVVLTLRERGADLLHIADGDVRVLLAEMELHRAAWHRLEEASDAPAVIGNARRNAGPAAGQVCDEPAPAVADHADGAGVGHRVDRRLQVGHDLAEIRCMYPTLACRHRRRQVDAMLLAIEDRGGNGQVTFGRELVGDAFDVPCHAEDLLDHDDAAARAAIRARQVGRERVAVGRSQWWLMAFAPWGRLAGGGVKISGDAIR